MPWSPLSRVAFAICAYPFSPSGADDLPLQIGDELYLIEEGGAKGEWYRGYLLVQPSLLAGLTSTSGESLQKRVFLGIFPAVCVEIREYLGDDSPQQSQLRSLHERQESSTESLVPSPPSRRKPFSPDQTPQKLETRRWRPVEDQAEPGHVESRITEHESDKSNESPETQSSGPKLPSPVFVKDQGRKPPRIRQKPPAPVPMLKISDESAMAKNEPLVDEIASCLREWQASKLHELLLDRQYRELHQMSQLLNRLDSTRKQLLAKVMTDSELEQLREQAVWDLSRGNKLFSGGVIVRSKQHRGRILTSDDSAVDITKLQATMSLLDDKPTTPTDSKSLYQFYADLKSLTPDSSKSTWLELSLYSKRQGQSPRLLSENFTVDLKDQSQSGPINFEGSQKTLFTDIAGTDVGEGANEQSNVFLMIKMSTNEPQYRRRSSAQSTPPSSSGTHTPGHPHAQRNVNSALRTGSIRSPAGAGRQSLMWGRKGRKDSDHSVPRVNHSRSETSASGQSGSNQGQQNQNTKLEEISRNEKPLRRVTGFAIVNVSRYVKSLKPADIKVEIKSLTTVFEDGTMGDDDEREVASKALGAIDQLHLAQTKAMLVMHVQAFQNPIADDLVQRTPTLFHNICMSNRLGFAGAPRKPRSDIYITLQRPAISDKSLLSHPREGYVGIPSEVGSLSNLVATLEVHNAEGQRISNAVWHSSNSNGHDAWRTLAVEQGASWNQTIRLSIDSEEVPGSHIVMSMADGFNFPFSLCWMPLWSQGAFIRDGDHALCLYKYDDHTSAMKAGKGYYMSLPWQASSRDESVTGPLASLHLRTYLCSTTFSQDPNLLGLLHHKDQSPLEIITLLKQFPFVPEIETVKLLKDVFDALFQVIVDNTNNDDIGDLGFAALITVLNIVHDRRFNLQPIVDAYVKNHFMFPFAFPCLMRSFRRLLEKPGESQNSRTLRAATKVGQYLFKFLIKARQQQVQKEVDIGINSHRQTFATTLQDVFAGIGKLMRDSNPVLVGTKTLLVQNFHTFLPELRGVMNSEEILTIATNFINSLSDVQGKLILFEILLIKHISDADLFPGEDTQEEWTANVFEWLAPHWGATDTCTSQWRDQIRLCCSVVATLFEKYGSHTTMWVRKLIESYKVVQKLSNPSTRMFSPLFPNAYPFPTRAINIDVKYDEALLEISALLSASSTLSANEFPKQSQEELTDGLLDLLHVSKSVLDFEAFPSNWISTHIYHHRSCLRFLQSLFTVLDTRYLPQPEDAEDFNDRIWRSYLNMLIQLVLSKAIALETFSEQRRRAIWKISGDIRESGAALLRQSWHGLGWDTTEEERQMYGLQRVGGYQLPFVHGLIGPIVELCLNVHDHLREVAVSILHSMIIGEWMLDGNLDTIQTNIITSIDKLYKTQALNDGMTQKSFIGELRATFEDSQCSGQSELMLSVKSLLDTLSELLDLLAAVFVPDSVGEIHQIYESMRLLEYYRALDKIDIYINYAHRLSNMQAQASNHTEAALALKLHADMLEWDTIQLLPASFDPTYPEQSAFERKEQIYFQMINHFEEGFAWNHALETYDELISQYQSYIFDFSKLARAHRAVATIYQKIGKGEGHTLRYFRVHFYGLGFSASLQNKQFIYETTSTEREASFKEKMQRQYPNAQVVDLEDGDELEGQYISVFAISPLRSLTHPSNRKIKVPQPVKEYHMNARPNKFANTTRKETSNQSVKAQVQRKTVYTTVEGFPNIMGRSEVVHSEEIQIAPIYIGIERALRKTNELNTITTQAHEGAETVMNNLTRLLMFLVSPGSTGSLAAYWDLLKDDMSIDLDGEDEVDSYVLDSDGAVALATLASKLPADKQSLLACLTDHVFAIRTALERYSRSAHQATGAELTSNLETSFAPVVAYIDSITPSSPDDLPAEEPRATHERKPSAPRNVMAAAHERKRSTASAKAGAQEPSEKAKPQPLSPIPNSVQGTPRVEEPVSPIVDIARERDRGGKPRHQKEREKPTSGSGEKVLHSQGSLHSFQARMGSVTKRLSQLNVGAGGFGVGGARKSPTIMEAEGGSVK